MFDHFTSSGLRAQLSGRVGTITRFVGSSNPNIVNHVRNNHHVQMNPGNIIETLKCADCPSEFTSKTEFENHTRNVHRRTDVEASTYSAIAKIGLQLENISKRLQSVKSKSMANIPILEGAQKKK